LSSTETKSNGTSATLLHSPAPQMPAPAPSGTQWATDLSGPPGQHTSTGPCRILTANSFTVPVHLHKNRSFYIYVYMCIYNCLHVGLIIRHHQ
jgi:hypothetical protein